MKMDIAVLSRAGGRPGNEDACGYWTSEAGCCWVLSDGAGGHGGGDVASKIVVGTIVSEFAALPEASPATVSGLIRRAHAVLQNEQQSEPRLRDMRATVAVLTIDRERRISCRGHVGDSRIYGFRSGHVRFQSRDHSVMQSMIDAGLGDAAMLRRHPQRGVLLAALGSPENVEPDVPPAGEPVRDGDVFMLCSDGLWEYVEESVMERLLAGSASAQAWLAALEAEVLAHAHSGHDNYSAIAVWVGDPAEDTQIKVVG